MSDDRGDFMQSPRHRLRERGSRRLALRSFFVKLCRARAIQLCALFTLAVNANAFRRERGWSIETSACDVRTSQRLGWPGSQTSKAEEVSVTLGTVIRGTEWSGRTANDRAVLNALDGLKRLVGVSNVVVFVDQDVRCDHVPSTYAGARCFGLERCVDPIYRAPSMKCVFQTLLDATRTKHVGYINGDIIIFRDFLDTLAAIERDYDRFFMVGRRRNALPAAQEEISHVRGEREWGKLESEACKSPIDGAGAIDYFVLPTRDAKYLRDIPPFIIGNWRWDNVVLALASTLMNLPVIDVTKTAIALHQGREKVVRREERPASAHNHGLAVRFMGKAYRRGSINCAEYESRYGTSRERNRVLVRAKRTISAWVCKHRETKAVSIMRQKFVA
mgnify:FL=1